MKQASVTVVELKAFVAKAAGLFSEDEGEALVEFLSYNPMAGVVIKGTGGIRKLHWGAKGKGRGKERAAERARSIAFTTRRCRSSC